MRDRSYIPSHHDRCSTPVSPQTLTKPYAMMLLNKYSSILLGFWRERNVLFNMHSTHFIYGYMASDIWLRTILIVKKEIRCRHIGYSYRLTARVLLYAPSHRQDNTYHGLCYTSRGGLAGTRNSSMGPLDFGFCHFLKCSL